MLELRHDPATCQRAECGRCRTRGVPWSEWWWPFFQNLAWMLGHERTIARPEKAWVPPLRSHDVQNPTPSPDPVVRSIGLPRHPTMHELAANLRKLAETLESDGDTAEHRASILAARGYPSQTLGDGGSRSTESTSSTERFGTRFVPGKHDVTRKPLPIPPDVKWCDIDRHLAEALAAVEQGRTRVANLIANINHHAADIDPIPVGQGECMACGRTCRPSVKADDRLRSGMCDACRKAWTRAGRPPRSTWIHERRAALTDAKGVLHPPQLDLERE